MIDAADPIREKTSGAAGAASPGAAPCGAPRPAALPITSAREPNALAAEVGRFLESLRREFPRLFEPPVRASPVPPARRPQAVLDPSPRERARAVLTRRAEFWGERIGVRWRRIAVRDQRSLWGSCSPRGNLSFNWRLLLAPPEVLDYVVIHELCHLLEMNHSRRFWRHVSRWCPDQRSLRRWLRRHDAELKASPDRVGEAGPATGEADEGRRAEGDELLDLR